MTRRRKKNKSFSRLTALLVVGAAVALLVLNRDQIEGWPGISKPVKPAPEPEKPKLVFVIDDIGYHLKEEKRLNQLAGKVTYAILPLLPYSRHFGNLGKKNGSEVILHMPLETLDGTIPGRGLIERSMSREEILGMIGRDLDSVPHHSGSNNHMGSLGTSSPELMRIILQEIKDRGLFYLDSFTSSDSVVVPIAHELGVPVLKRDVFLDNIDAKQPIRDQIRQLKSVARKKGYAIGIGHYRTNTLEVLIQDIPQMEAEGFQIVSLRNILDSKQKKKAAA
ncbi:MAG: divergent polysaccharide deacetylase family protein [Candidatus Omnitrophica bacterium]|nr:divergent polysaccharide deacetylase family protein [Candidatus Omnitrophota bacterium]